jgi:hypothetical protein
VDLGSFLPNCGGGDRKEIFLPLYPTVEKVPTNLRTWNFSGKYFAAVPAIGFKNREFV